MGGRAFGHVGNVIQTNPGLPRQIFQAETKFFRAGPRNLAKQIKENRKGKALGIALISLFENQAFARRCADP